MAVLIGIHPVREALLAGRPIDRVLVAKGAGGPRIQEIVDLCRQHKVALRFEPREALDRSAGGTARHQGVVAFAAEKRYDTFDDILAQELIVVLDGVEDPHNLGAILRTASAAGAGAVIIPERRAVGVNETVAKAAAGALEHVPIVRVTNIAQSLEKLKKSGFWIYGLDERGERNYTEAAFDPKSVLVLGAEGHGLHDNVRKGCDFLLRIPMSGPIPSLNVSVAAGVVLFDWKRQRGKF
ncbi:MAG: 23S rRNA (guanosine(2251)-2'-O)-methyltransferase RlmB [Bryobacter sp.]|jgi:23S rRNA (guanosine2251-2'-O)-methyltransferase|nr:23S rRNA (guanosine(2251)-2'-O)-methyltransferase RlmB [Bryobacter sp. CoA8 C33]